MKVDKQGKEMARRLRGGIAESKKNVETIAKNCGINETTLWKYTSGRVSPSIRILKAICMEAEVDINYVINGSRR